MGTVSASDLRVGNVIEKDGHLFRLTKVSYTQGQARQSGNVQVELKNIRTGSKQSQRLSPSDKLEKAVLDETPHSFLYQTGSELVLMHDKTYDQVEVNVELLGDAVRFLSDECEVTLLTHEGVIVSAALSEEPCPFTYFSARGRAREKGKGWRLDYCVLAEALRPRLRAAHIHADVPGSDHLPISVDLDFERALR